MPHDHRALIGQLRELLTQQRYNAVAIQNYCRSADHFLNFLAQRKIAVEAATPAEVSHYLRCSARRFRSVTVTPRRLIGNPFRGRASMGCCGSCRSVGHLNLRQRAPVRFSAKRYAPSTESGCGRSAGWQSHRSTP